MSNHATGHEAEQRVAKWLKSQEFKVVDINWRTRRCEIDIIASKHKVLYFVEVKSRQSNNWGNGFDYITPQKLAQMHYAAELWLTENQWDDDVRLAAVAVSENAMEFIELVD
jgi:putative endonuclease